MSFDFPLSVFSSKLTEPSFKAPRDDAVQRHIPLDSLSRLWEARSLHMVVALCCSVGDHACGNLRSKATLGQWDELQKSDVVRDHPELLTEDNGWFMPRGLHGDAG